MMRKFSSVDGYSRISKEEIDEADFV
jgi:hypothetical protein